MPCPSDIDSEKCKKLKVFIIGAVIVSGIIVGWHLYEYFGHENKGADEETAIEHEIHELTQRLFADEMKHNRYLAKINYQGRTNSYEKADQASQALLQLNDDLLTSDTSSTTYLMRRLFDNYELDTSVVEHVTAEESREEVDFLEAVLKTPLMKHAMKFLQKKGYASADPKLQLKLLHDIWFTQYSRGRGIVGSSGFEHVFLAEVKDHSILGLHNWIYFHEQEKAGNLDYKGFIQRVDLGKDDQHLLALRFSFYDVMKPYNTLFVGTSPELELSLYTICFLMRRDQSCPVQLGQTKFSIITHSWDWHGVKTIGTAYPNIDLQEEAEFRTSKKRGSTLGLRITISV